MYISSIRASNPIRLLHASRKLSAEFQSVLWNPNGATSDVTSYEFSLYVPRRQSEEYSTNPWLLLRETRFTIRSFNYPIALAMLCLVRERSSSSWSSSTSWRLKISGKRKRNLLISYSRIPCRLVIFVIKLNVEKCYLWIMGYGDHMVVQ